jgi:hypothetical protein
MKLAHKLKHRISIQEAVQTPNDAGGFDKSYTTLTTIWARMDNVSDNTRNLIYIRGENDSDQKTPTHKFLVRWAAVKNLGKEFNSAFSSDFDSIEDLMPLKSDMFIFLHQGSAYKGRRFQILDISRDENNKEWLKFRAAEIEEIGTGWPE